jgi:hypothetical protein
MATYDSITQQINTIVKTPEPAGTMFSKIGPLDQQRDLTVKNITHEFDNQTTSLTVNKQIKDVVGFFNKAFGINKSAIAQNKTQITQLQSSITDSQSVIDQLGLTGPVVQQLLILVASVAVIYYFGSFLGSLVHFAALIVLIGGMYYIISGTPNNGQSGFVTSIFSAIGSFFSSLTSSL